MSLEHLRQRLVERARLLLGVVDRGEDLRPVLSRDLGGVVGAVVGDDHHPVRWPGLAPQRFQRRGDRERLVVRRHQHRQAQRRPAPQRALRQLARRKLRIVGQPDRRRTERRQHARPEPGASPARAAAESAGPARARASPPRRAERPARRRRLPRPRRRPGGATRTECRRSAPSGSWPTMSFGSARNATHIASARKTRVRPISATDSQLNRATRLRSGRFSSVNARSFADPGRHAGRRHHPAGVMPATSAARAAAAIRLQ